MLQLGSSRKSEPNRNSKPVPHLQAVRQRFQTITARFAGFQSASFYQSLRPMAGSCVH